MISLLCVICVFHFGLGANPVLEKQPQNTTRQDRIGIVGGQNASIESFPFLASVLVDGDFIGSAVILNRRWLLTTAYAVVGEDVSDVVFRVGSNQYNQGGHLLQAQDIIIPSSYIGNYDWDVALVKVKKPITYRRTVRPVRISHKELKDGTKALIAGWGSNKDSSSIIPSVILQQTNVTILGKKKCKKSTSYKQFSSRNMCTYDNDTGPVLNDFGDPLVIGNVVHGIFAGGYNLKPGTEPLIYSDISKYHRWIKQHMRR